MLAAFFRALPTMSPSISLSTSTFFLHPMEVTFLMTSNGSSSSSHAQTTYGRPFASSPSWGNSPLKEPWGPPVIHHSPRVPPVPPSSSVSTRALSLLALDWAQHSLPLVNNRLLCILEPHAGLIATVGRRLSSVLVQDHYLRLLAVKHHIP